VADPQPDPADLLYDPNDPPRVRLGNGFTNPPPVKPIPASFTRAAIAAELRRRCERAAAAMRGIHRLRRKQLVPRLRASRCSSTRARRTRSHRFASRSATADDDSGGGDGDDPTRVELLLRVGPFIGPAATLDALGAWSR
jgi:hypothetical protein